MDFSSKGINPFTPDQPVSVELFKGRKEEIKIAMQLAHQVELGQQKACMIVGDYGIGKTSFARYIAEAAADQFSLAPIFINLAGITNLTDMFVKAEHEVKKVHYQKYTFGEKLRTHIAALGSVNVFGILDVDLSKVKANQPSFAVDFVGGLRKIYEKLAGGGAKGLLLILDELNGLAEEKDFAYFLKGMYEENSNSSERVPFMLSICATQQKRAAMVSNHEPISRIFEVIHFNKMNDEEARDFFRTTFQSINFSLDDDAVDMLVEYSEGYPRIMHEIGNATFWATDGQQVTLTSARNGINKAIEVMGQKFIEPVMIKEIRSERYKNILTHLPKITTEEGYFRKKDLSELLNEDDKRILGNFLTKLTKSKIIRQSDSRGEYQFFNAMTKSYIKLIWAPERLKSKK